MMRRTIATITSLAALALGVGCGGAAPPLRGREETVAAVRAAREVGAAEQPRAAYHLELAEEQLHRADSLAERGRTPDAQRMLQRAQADAELAVALTQEAAALAEAEAVRRRIREMRERPL